MKEFFDSLEGAASHSFDETSLAPVRQFNALALETLTGCARHPAWTGSAWEAALGPNFTRVSAEFMAELAKSPVTLLEFAGPQFPAAGALAKATRPDFFPLDKATELTQISLTLAWTFSRHDPAATGVIFGLSIEDIGQVRSLDVRDIPRLAERAVSDLRPRWFDRPRVWQELLRHAGTTNGFYLAPPYLRILQRQLTHTGPATGATSLTRRADP